MLLVPFQKRVLGETHSSPLTLVLGSDPMPIQHGSFLLHLPTAAIYLFLKHGSVSYSMLSTMDRAANRTDKNLCLIVMLMSKKCTMLHVFCAKKKKERKKTPGKKIQNDINEEDF